MTTQVQDTRLTPATPVTLCGARADGFYPTWVRCDRAPDHREIMHRNRDFAVWELYWPREGDV